MAQGAETGSGTEMRAGSLSEGATFQPGLKPRHPHMHGELHRSALTNRLRVESWSTTGNLPMHGGTVRLKGGVESSQAASPTSCKAGGETQHLRVEWRCSSKHTHAGWQFQGMLQLSPAPNSSALSAGQSHNAVLGTMECMNFY